MDTFDMPIQIMTTSLHDIRHHEIHSPHRHSPIFFTFNALNAHSNKSVKNVNNIKKVYKKNSAQQKNDERLIELLMISSQPWT